MEVSRVEGSVIAVTNRGWQGLLAVIGPHLATATAITGRDRPRGFVPAPRPTTEQNTKQSVIDVQG
jgi:hypothetical protein